MKKYKRLQKAAKSKAATKPENQNEIPVKIKAIQISKIIVDKNPRKRFDKDSIDGLAESIRERALQQPIIVEPGEGDTFILVSGERRIRAHKKLGRLTIPAIIRDKTNHNGLDRFLDAIIENDQRENMSPIELGQAYRMLWETYDMSTRDIARRTGRREGFIQDHLRLTELYPEIQDMIEQGFWKDPQLIRLILKIKDRDVCIDLVSRLFKDKVSIQGCINAIQRAFSMMAMDTGKFANFKEGTPALKVVGIKQPPRRWGMLSQLGRIPPWSVVVHSAEQTCNLCPLRDIASVTTCKDCGAVQLLRNLMEIAK